MAKTVNWSVTVDTVTDALVRSQLAKEPAPASLDAFVKGAVERELDRLALLQAERARKGPVNASGMWEIVIPLPPRQ